MSSEAEILANLERAKDSIIAASSLLDQGFPDFAASRAYYAAFYAATALLVSEGLTFSKHSGVISHIHKEFVRTGKLDKQSGQDLNWLFELRNVGDYGETRHVPEADARQAIAAASGFLENVERLIRGEPDVKSELGPDSEEEKGDERRSLPDSR